MATVRNGARGALIVVDVQVGVVAQAWEAEHVIGHIAHAVARARAQGVPVIWVQHENDELPHGSPPWQWVPALVPTDGELRIFKRFNSAFEETALEAELAARGVAHVVLAGAATNWCIRATAYAALERGYDLTLVKDGHTTDTMVLDDGTRIEAAGVVNDLNVAMRWLEYAGRRNAAVDAEAVDFAALAGAH